MNTPMGANVPLRGHRSLTGGSYSIGGDDDEQQPPLFLPEELPFGVNFDPLVILFFGRRGDGKTLSMTALMDCMRRRYEASGQKYSSRNPEGFKLASNYHVQFADFNDPKVVDMVNAYDDRFRKMLLSVDEILSYVPSRRSNARSNVDFANFLVQIRKLDMELLSTTQRPQNIDSQMLDQIDLFISPILFNKRWIMERALWTGKPTGKLIWAPTAVRLQCWDWWGTFTGDQRRKPWPPQVSGERPDYILDLHNIDGIFHQFSSKEQVPSIWSANRDDVLLRSWEKEMRVMADALNPEIAEVEAEGVPDATMADLVKGQGDTVDVREMMEQARQAGISGTYPEALRLLEGSGYSLIKKGRSSGHLAQRVAQ